MIFSILLAAIIWNLGTWYFGLPASSSHTLIGAIIGIAVTNAFVTGESLVEALNLPKVVNIFLSLILSPIVGMAIAGLLIFLLRKYWSGTKKRRRNHMTPAEREKKDGKKKPPFWTRIALIVSAIGVSYSHGANDGQKGIGLVMLVLIGVAPAGFVVNMNSSSYDITRTRDAVNHLEQYYQQHDTQIANLIAPAKPASAAVDINEPFRCSNENGLIAVHHAQNLLSNLSSYDQLTPDNRSQVRRLLLCMSDTTDKITKLPSTSAADKRFLSTLKGDLTGTIEYAPIWIILAVALALSLGTMVGWRRVATTIGEKIGKNGMTYAQGMSAQVTAAVSIGIASYTGMPVSTTHILSSSVAGTMIVDGGGVQTKTIRSIALAWVLTLPISILLSGALYWIALQIV